MKSGLGKHCLKYLKEHNMSFDPYRELVIQDTNMFVLLELRVRLEPLTCLSPPVSIFLLTVSRRCFFCGSFSCLSCFLVCSLQPCGHLLGKG